MVRNNEIQDIDIKNCTCHNFDGIISINDFDLNNNWIKNHTKIY